jgi:hypothetical protein
VTFSEYAKSFVNSRPSDLASPPLIVKRDALSTAARRATEDDSYLGGPYVVWEISGGPVSLSMYDNTDEVVVRQDVWVWQPPVGNDIADRTDVDLLFDLLAHAPQFVDADEDGRLFTRNSFRRLALVPPRLSQQTGLALVGTLRFAYGVRL